jgi:hypothetical protein
MMIAAAVFALFDNCTFHLSFHFSAENRNYAQAVVTLPNIYLFGGLFGSKTTRKIARMININQKTLRDEKKKVDCALLTSPRGSRTRRQQCGCVQE